jgi:hypothetical protein
MIVATKTKNKYKKPSKDMIVRFRAERDTFMTLHMKASIFCDGNMSKFLRLAIENFDYKKAVRNKKT